MTDMFAPNDRVITDDGRIGTVHNCFTLSEGVTVNGEPMQPGPYCAVVFDDGAVESLRPSKLAPYVTCADMEPLMLTEIYVPMASERAAASMWPVRVGAVAAVGFVAWIGFKVVGL